MTRADIVIVLIILALVGGGFYWWLAPSAQDRLAEVFAPHIDAYLEQTRLIGDQYAVQGISDQPLGVKTVAIDIHTKTLDAIHHLLPDRYRATTSAEVNSVVLVDCEQILSGSFDHFKDAYSVECQLRTYDLELKELVWRSSRRNPPPRRAFPIPFLDVVADRPNELMVDLMVTNTKAPQ